MYLNATSESMQRWRWQVGHRRANRGAFLLRSIAAVELNIVGQAEL